LRRDCLDNNRRLGAKSDEIQPPTIFSLTVLMQTHPQSIHPSSSDWYHQFMLLGIFNTYFEIQTLIIADLVFNRVFQVECRCILDCLVTAAIARLADLDEPDLKYVLRAKPDTYSFSDIYRHFNETL
jgi:hypothetical protein